MNRASNHDRQPHGLAFRLLSRAPGPPDATLFARLTRFVQVTIVVSALAFAVSLMHLLEIGWHARWIIGAGAFAVLVGAILFAISAVRKQLAKIALTTEVEHHFTTAALDGQQDLFLLFDPVSRNPIRWNRAVNTTTGFSDDEIRSRSVPDGWVAPDTSDKARAIMGSLTDGTLSSCDIRIASKTGETLHLELKAALFRPLPGDPDLVLVTARDIRDRKIAEQALAESEKRYRRIIENVPSVFWFGGRKNRLTYISPNVEQILGYAPLEIVTGGEPFWLARVSPEDRASVRASFDALLRNGTPHNLQYRLDANDGRRIWVHERASVAEASGEGMSIYGVITDVTEQVEIAEHLRQSEKMQAIGEMAGGVAHDFNNQLTAIMGCADLLIREAGNGKFTQRYLKEMRRSALHASELTRQLLTFARRKAHRSAPMNVHHVVDEVASLLTRSIDRRISIHKSLRAKYSVVVGDAAQLQNTLLNLCLNARDAMPEGGRLTLGTDNIVRQGVPTDLGPGRLPKGRYIVISVMDTGEGMDAETQRRIFEPFFTTKPEGKGTGMGLATVFGYVCSQQGDIKVDSSPGHGSTMTIYLPSANNVVTVDKASVAPPAAPKTEGNILLVDDEDSILLVVSDLLRDMGYSVRRCTDGGEAIDEYRRHWPEIDLVILDMMMPRLDGSSTFSALHQINKDIKVLIATGFDRNEKVETVLRQGAKGYLRKPFTAYELAEKLTEVIQS